MNDLQATQKQTGESLRDIVEGVAPLCVISLLVAGAMIYSEMEKEEEEKNTGR